MQQKLLALVNWRLKKGPECATKINDAIKKELISCIDGQSAAQQARRVICPQKWLEEIAHKIRNVGDDILDIMEKLGGHTLEKHVGKPYDYLKKRISNTKKGSATTFTNKRTAIACITKVTRLKFIPALALNLLKGFFTSARRYPSTSSGRARRTQTCRAGLIEYAILML